MKKLLLSLSCLTISVGATASLISCSMRSKEVEISFKDGLKPENFDFAQPNNATIDVLNKIFQLLVYTNKGKESLKEYMGEEAIKENSFINGNSYAKEFIEFVSKPNRYEFKLNLNHNNNKPQKVNLEEFKPLEFTKEINSNKIEKIDYENAKISDKKFKELAQENDLVKQLVEKYENKYFLTNLLDLNLNEITFKEPIKAISSEKYFNEVAEKIDNLEGDLKLKDKKSELKNKIEKEDDQNLKSYNYQKYADELFKDLKSSNLYKIEPLKKEMEYMSRLSLFKDKNGDEHQSSIDDSYYVKTKSIEIELQVIEKDEIKKSIKVEVPQLYLVFAPSFLKEKKNTKSVGKNFAFLEFKKYQFSEFELSKNIFKGLKIKIK